MNKSSAGGQIVGDGATQSTHVRIDSIRLAGNRSELARIQSYRTTEYRKTAPHLVVDLHESADAIDPSDLYSHVFYIGGDPLIAASVRYTHVSAHWCPQLDQESRFIIRALVPQDAVEIARLMVAPPYRGTGILDRLLGGSAQWLLSNYSYVIYFAICEPSHVPLYTTRYGARFVKMVPLIRKNGTRADYALISSPLNTLRERAMSRLSVLSSDRKGGRRMDSFFQELDNLVKAKWDEIHAKPFWQHLRRNGLDKDLYFCLMREIYHFTRHNTQNQALAAVDAFSDQLEILRYALHHAYAEAGHDQMVIADLKSAGFDWRSVEESRPLPETLAFIAYLYRVAAKDGPVARLGYSYWAESCYGYIAELTDAMKSQLGLSDEQMTFFVEHSTIDVGHFNQVRRIITECAKSERDRDSIKSVLKESLHLLGVVLDGVYKDYLGSKEDASVVA